MQMAVHTNTKDNLIIPTSVIKMGYEFKAIAHICAIKRLLPVVDGQRMLRTYMSSYHKTGFIMVTIIGSKEGVRYV